MTPDEQLEARVNAEARLCLCGHPQTEHDAVGCLDLNQEGDGVCECTNFELADASDILSAENPEEV